MPLELNHALKVRHERDSQARQDFVSALRGYVLNDMAENMRTRFETNVAPQFARRMGRQPADQDEVHGAMREDLYFRFYSAIRYNAQEMVWRSVIPGIEVGIPGLERTLKKVCGSSGGSLTLDPDLKMPANVEGLDVHLMPGGYTGTEGCAPGAVYDNGLAVFSAGLMGKNLDDIGQSMAHYVKLRFPDFRPQRILDCGCTVGHNAAAWAETFPDAEMHAVDVSASVLKYAHGRAEALGLPMHFHQMDATALGFDDASVDVVFSSMFLHEMSVKDIDAFFREAHRVLRPSGLLINMELPPNAELGPYDQFYLDWDCYYNREPFYRAYRDRSPKDLITAAGFDPAGFFQFTVPQYTYVPNDAFEAAVAAPHGVDSDTGRLSASVSWFGYGVWKGAPPH